MEKEKKEKAEFVEVRVKGKDSELWKEFKPKLIKIVDSLLNTIINYEDNTSIKEEARIFGTKFIKYAKAKLDKPSLENQRLNAEIEQIYLTNEKIKAETRKINIENALNGLKAALILSKGIALLEKDEDTLIFLNSLNDFLALVDEENKRKQLPQ